MLNYLFIGMGGFLGALARYLVMRYIGEISTENFPWPTLAVNVLGAIILGVILEYMIYHREVAAEWRSFLVIGFLGALTTFSTFTMDALLLLEREQFITAFVYMAGSCLSCLGAMFLAMRICRSLFIPF